MAWLKQAADFRSYDINGLRVTIDRELEELIAENNLILADLLNRFGEIILNNCLPMVQKRLNVSEDQTLKLLAQLDWRIEAPPHMPPNTVASYHKDIVEFNINALVPGYRDDKDLGATIIHELEHWFLDILRNVPTDDTHIPEYEQNYDAAPGSNLVGLEAWTSSPEEQIADVARYRALLDEGYTEEQLLSRVKPEMREWTQWIIELAKDADPQTVVSKLAVQ